MQAGMTQIHCDIMVIGGEKQAYNFCYHNILICSFTRVMHCFSLMLLGTRGSESW